MAIKSMFVSLLFGVAVFGFGCCQVAETQNEARPVITTCAPDALHVDSVHEANLQSFSEEKEFEDPRPFCRAGTQCRTILLIPESGMTEEHQPCQCVRGSVCTYIRPFSIHDSVFPMEFYCKPRLDRDLIAKYARSLENEEAITTKSEETTDTEVKESTVTDNAKIVLP